VHLVVARDPMGYAARLPHGFCWGSRDGCGGAAVFVGWVVGVPGA